LNSAVKLKDYISLPFETGVYSEHELDAADVFFREHGFVILRGLWDEEIVAQSEAECVDAREKVLSGELDTRHGNISLIDDGKTQFKTANYVQYITEIAPATRACM